MGPIFSDCARLAEVTDELKAYDHYSLASLVANYRVIRMRSVQNLAVTVV